MKHLAPSILSADFANLGRDVELISEGGADFIHIDVMDGVFVPNISFGPCVIKGIRKNTKSVFDVHLMITEPHRYLKEFAAAGADYITIHAEAGSDIEECIKTIKNLGCKAGLSIKPKTQVEEIEKYLPDLDLLLVMSVEPGFGGQGYLDSADEKISKLKQIKEEKGYDYLISVDGGIKLTNVRNVLERGCDVVVAGSAVFAADDIKAECGKWTEIFKEYE